MASKEVIKAIGTLSDLLQGQLLDRERAEADSRSYCSRMNDLEDANWKLQEELRQSKDRIQTLEYDRAFYQQRYDQFRDLGGKAGLWLAFLRNPSKMMQCLEWLTGPEAGQLQGQKIEKIKRIRTIGGLGLKEAKDLVEGYDADPYTMYCRMNPPPEHPSDNYETDRTMTLGEVPGFQIINGSAGHDTEPPRPPQFAPLRPDEP